MNAFRRLQMLRAANDEAGARMEAMRPRFDRLRDRHANGVAPRAVSSFNLFQTPVEIAAMMAEAAGITADTSVLEPSAGLGRLVNACLAAGCGRVVAVEVSPDCAGELYRMELDGMEIRQRDFLLLSPDELGQFDRVVMNPPFHMRADIAHIQHASRFVKPGGRLVALCMDTHHRREAFASMSYTQLPARSFRKEGTGIDVAMLVADY